MIPAPEREELFIERLYFESVVVPALRSGQLAGVERNME